jgi:RHS repeat-associated protein
MPSRRYLVTARERGARGRIWGRSGGRRGTHRTRPLQRPNSRPLRPSGLGHPNEVGELAHALRWDLNGGERTPHGFLGAPLPTRAPDAELKFSYDASGGRTLKTSVDPAGLERHTAYIFGGYELRSVRWDQPAYPLDYNLSPEKVQLRLPAGMATARVLYSNESLPTLTSGQQHVFLELSDQVGSNTFVIDHATGELVEAATYAAYGAAESDYRPGRWGQFREPFRFSGKEEDIELGLSYFGARYYSPYLGVWMSADPSTIHEGGSDVNPYAYVNGSPLMGVDPDGREPITIGIVVGAVIIGAVIGAGTSVAIQASNVGWDDIDWGLKGVAGAAITGAVAGAVTLGAGSWIGGALSASSNIGGALAAGAITGAIGSSSSYVTSSLLAGQRMSLGGFGKAAAVGGAGGLAGAAAGFGGASLASEFGASESTAQSVGAGAGAAGGSSGSLATSMAFGDQMTALTFAMSYAGGLAGAMAGKGWNEATSPSETPATASSAAPRAKASGGSLLYDGPEAQRLAAAIAEMPDNRLAAVPCPKGDCSSMGDATSMLTGGPVATVGGKAAAPLLTRFFRWAAAKLGINVAARGAQAAVHPALKLPGAANTINHIFGKSAHNLEGLVTQLGSREAAYTALYDATNAVVRAQGTTGLFQSAVDVAGQTVTVRGNVIDGVLRISTAFVP